MKASERWLGAQARTPFLGMEFASLPEHEKLHAPLRQSREIICRQTHVLKSKSFNRTMFVEHKHGTKCRKAKNPGLPENRRRQTACPAPLSCLP